MPELPEVETIVRDLRPQLEGRVVRRAWLSPVGVLRYPDPPSFRRRIVGHNLASVRRHGKFIFIDLDGAGDHGSVPASELLAIHLGMTGRLSLDDPEAVPPPHTHLRLLLSSGAELRLQDYRRFGRVVLGSLEELRAHRVLPVLGPEPFNGALTQRQFDAVLRRSRRPLKALLLDQSRLAGLGNIYADEACFRAGIRPTAVAAKLTPERRRRLLRAIDDTLASATERRGSSVDDYRDGFGEKGRNQEVLLVYGRAGLPCPRCHGTLVRTVVAGRTTVYCPRCQR